MKTPLLKQRILLELILLVVILIFALQINFYKLSDSIRYVVNTYTLTPIEVAKKATAIITIKEGKKKGYGMGSGVVVTSTGLIITNKHVIDKSSKIRVQVQGKFYTPKVLFVSKKMDIAFLKIEPKLPLVHVRIAIAEDMDFGSDVYCIGNPKFLLRYISKGIISRFHVEPNGVSYVLTDAFLQHGSSGGGMFNPKGELIGINSIILYLSKGVPAGVGIAISTKSFIKDLNKYYEK